MKELEDKLAHEVVKPNLRNTGDSKQEVKPTAPYWFKDGKYYKLQTFYLITLHLILQIMVRITLVTTLFRPF